MPYTRRTTARASKRSIGWVHIENLDPFCLCLVFEKLLQLFPRPPVQSGAKARVPLHAFANISQIFENKNLCSRRHCLLDNRFADTMVGLPDASALFTRDSLRASLCPSRTVGLQPTSPFQKLVPFVSKRSSSIDCATRCGGKVVFSKIDGKDSALMLGLNIGKFDNQVEEPAIPLSDQLSLFNFALSHVFALTPSKGKRTPHSSPYGKEGEPIFFEGKGAGAIVNTSCFLKSDLRNLLVSSNAKCLVASAHLANPVANHLRTKPGKGCSQGAVAKVVQGDLIPAAVISSKFRDLIASARKQLLRLQKRCRLFFSQMQFQSYCTLHMCYAIANITFNQQKEERRFLPHINEGVSAPSFG